MSETEIVQAMVQAAEKRPRKRSVTMKELIEERAKLMMRVHALEVELARFRKSAFWPRVVNFFGR